LIPDIEKFLPVAIFKMAAQYRTNSTLSDFNAIIVAVILKMATGRNFSMSGNQFRTSLSTHISNFDDIGQC
jgi:hypothetical protein